MTKQIAMLMVLAIAAGTVMLALVVQGQMLQGSPELRTWYPVDNVEPTDECLASCARPSHPTRPAYGTEGKDLGYCPSRCLTQ